MYKSSNAAARYGRIANSETDPIKQIVMLYDGAIKFLNLTAADIEAGNYVAKGEHSTRALDIISYLQNTLDFEKGEKVAVNLDNLYRSVSMLILRASAELNAPLMRRAALHLVPVRDAWAINAGKTVTVPTLRAAV
jgi:flagellar secretion chaperone FliS